MARSNTHLIQSWKTGTNRTIYVRESSSYEAKRAKSDDGRSEKIIGGVRKIMSRYRADEASQQTRPTK